MENQENKINQTQSVKIDKGTLSPEDYENTKLITLDDGTQQEVYISRAGNVVTPPKDRAKNYDTNRQQLCWDLYIKSIKNGNPSARQAALDAGFARNTALNIRNLAWFKSKLRTLKQSKMMSNAERNVSRALRVQWSKMKINDDGTEEIEVTDKDLFKTVMDTSWKVLETLGKEKGYNKKIEVEGNMGGEIKINSVSYADAKDSIESKVIDTVIDIESQPILEEIKKEE